MVRGTGKRVWDSHKALVARFCPLTLPSRPMGERAQPPCIVCGHYVSLGSPEACPETRIQCWGDTGNTSSEMGKYNREGKAVSQGLIPSKLPQSGLDLNPAEEAWETVEDMDLRATARKGESCGICTPAPIICFGLFLGSVDVNYLEFPACLVLEKQTTGWWEEIPW